MPPKKNKGAEELDILEQLRILAEKVEKVSTKQDQMSAKQDQIADLMQEVKHLREVNARQQVKIESLEDRVDELEQYTRKDDLIITGLKVKHRSYARAASGDGDEAGGAAPPSELNQLECKVVEFFESKDMQVNQDYISTCHVLGKGDRENPPKIIVRFSNRKEKVRLLRQGRKLKDTGVYINEHLTRKNVQIAKHARKLRKDKEVNDTWTRNCIVFVKLTDLSVRKVLSAQDFVKYGLPAMPSY